MSATLDYEMKKCMGLLCKDSRWNVLTVLILHANVRNRCFVGMDTIAELATAGNVNKATRVKKWLIAHGAFELVPHDKRVDEECDLPQRQHVYQLTGKLKACANPVCDCHEQLKSPLRYLHYAKDVISEDNNKEQKGAEVISDDNFNQGKVITIENINGDNLSTTNTSKRKESRTGKKPARAKPYDDVPHKLRTEIIEAWAKNLEAAPANAYKTDTNHDAAADIARAGYTPSDTARYVESAMKDSYWKGKTLTLSKVSELMPAWLARHRPKPAPTQALSHDTEAAPITINQFVRKAETNHVA